jgi:hypothetical protein
VVFREIADEETSSGLDVMARIIDTALQGHSRTPIASGSGTHGFYLGDYGVVFFTQANFGNLLNIEFFESGGSIESIERRIIELQTDSRKRRENWNVEYEKFKQRLGEVLVDYGHTLRQLKPDDHILISAELDDPPEDGPHQLVCRVKKQHIDAFNSRRISREQLTKLISYMEF